jgi:hypothetical protein
LISALPYKFSTMWYKIIKAKYDEQEGGWCSKEVLGPYGVGLWKHIRRGWDSLAKGLQFKVWGESSLLVRYLVR